MNSVQSYVDGNDDEGLFSHSIIYGNKCFYFDESNAQDFDEGNYDATILENYIEHCITIARENGLQVDSSALHCVCFDGNHPKVIQDMIEKGERIDAQAGELEITPLMATVLSDGENVLEIVHYLVEKGKEKLVNMTDKEGFTALHYACDVGNLTVIQYLIRHGAIVNVAARSNGVTPLHMTISGRGENVLEIVSGLVEKGKKKLVNMSAKTGWRAINHAAYYGRQDILEYLVEECHANIESKDIDNNTVLMNAAVAGRYAATKYLLKKGVNIEVQDLSYGTALRYAYTAPVWKYLREIVKIMELLERKQVTEKEYVKEFIVLLDKKEMNYLRDIQDECMLLQKKKNGYLTEFKDVFETFKQHKEAYLKDCVNDWMKRKDRMSIEEFVAVFEFLLKSNKQEEEDHEKVSTGSVSVKETDTIFVEAYEVWKRKEEKYVKKSVKEWMLSRTKNYDKVYLEDFVKQCLEVFALLKRKEEEYFLNNDMIYEFKAGREGECVRELNEVCALFRTKEMEYLQVIWILLSVGKHLNIDSPIGSGIIHWIARELNIKEAKTYPIKLQIAMLVVARNEPGDITKMKETLKSFLETQHLPLIAMALWHFLCYVDSPIAFLNTYFATHLVDTISHYVTEGLSYHVLLYWMQIYQGLISAAAYHPSEAPDLYEFAKKLEMMVSELLGCNLFDEPIHMLQLLSPAREMTSLEYIYVLEKTSSVITFCVQHKIKFLFDKPHMTSIFDHLLMQTSTIPVDVNTYANASTHIPSLFTWSLAIILNSKLQAWEKEYVEYEFTREPELKIAQQRYLQMTKFTHELRRIPYYAILAEIGSKLILLGLVAHIVIYHYGSHFTVHYYSITTNTAAADDITAFDTAYQEYEVITRDEMMLMIYAWSDVLYEMGQLIHSGKQMHQWFSHTINTWNLFDVLSSACVLLWMILRYYGSREWFSIARVSLCLSAIPISFGILRYCSLYKPLGELVLLLMGMGEVLFTFAIVYIVSIIGFGIAFYGLFTHTAAYDTVGYTLLTLLQNTLGNFDYDAFSSGSNVEVNYLGIVLLVIFLIFAAIILMNLLIAQMSNVYGEIKLRAQQEWGFSYATLVSEYVLLHEPNAFCALPVPFNLLSILCVLVLYPIYLLYPPNKRCYDILIATICNLFYSTIIGSWIRFFYSLYFIVDTIKGQSRLLYYEEIGIFKLRKLLRFMILFPILAFIAASLDFLIVPFWILWQDIYYGYPFQQEIDQDELNSGKFDIDETAVWNVAEQSKDTQELNTPPQLEEEDDDDVENEYQIIYMKTIPHTLKTHLTGRHQRRILAMNTFFKKGYYYLKSLLFSRKYCYQNDPHHEKQMIGMSTMDKKRLLRSLNPYIRSSQTDDFVRLNHNLEEDIRIIVQTAMVPNQSELVDAIMKVVKERTDAGTTM